MCSAMPRLTTDPLYGSDWGRRRWLQEAIWMSIKLGLLTQLPSPTWVRYRKIARRTSRVCWWIYLTRTLLRTRATQSMEAVAAATSPCKHPSAKTAERTSWWVMRIWPLEARVDRLALPGGKPATSSINRSTTLPKSLVKSRKSALALTAPSRFRQWRRTLTLMMTLRI